MNSNGFLVNDIWSLKGSNFDSHWIIPMVQWIFYGTSNAILCLVNLHFRPPHNWNCMPWNYKTGGVVCGEFLDESIRDSEEARTRTNGVAKRGERDSVRDPEWRSRKQGPAGDAQRRELQRPERRCSGLDEIHDVASLYGLKMKAPTARCGRRKRTLRNLQKKVECIFLRHFFRGFWPTPVSQNETLRM